MTDAEITQPDIPDTQPLVTEITPDSTDDAPITYASMKQVSAARNISVATLRAAKASGAPGFHASGRVHWHLLGPWLAVNADRLTQDDQEGRDHWSLLKLKSEAQRAELIYNKEAGQLASKEEIARQIEALWSAVKPVLRQKIEEELPLKIVGLDIHKARAEAAKVFDSLCVHFQGDAWLQ